MKGPKIDYEEEEDYLFSEQRPSLPVQKSKEVQKAPSKIDVVKEREFMFYDGLNQEE